MTNAIRHRRWAIAEGYIPEAPWTRAGDDELRDCLFAQHIRSRRPGGDHNLFFRTGSGWALQANRAGKTDETCAL